MSQNEHKMLGNLFVSYIEMTSNVYYLCIHLNLRTQKFKLLTRNLGINHLSFTYLVA